MAVVGLASCAEADVALPHALNKGLRHHGLALVQSVETRPRDIGRANIKTRETYESAVRCNTPLSLVRSNLVGAIRCPPAQVAPSTFRSSSDILERIDDLELPLDDMAVLQVLRIERFARGPQGGCDMTES